MNDSPSPFLSSTNIQFAWDSTSLGYLKTCPRLYQYIMIDGWGSRDESIHLRFGIEYHSSLQDYEVLRAQNIPHEAAIHEVVRNLLQRIADWHPKTDTKAGRYKNRDTIVSLVISYLDHYGKDDPAITHVLDNGKPAVELSFRFELDWGPETARLGEWTNEFTNRTFETGTAQPYLLCGHLDRVVNFNDSLMVMDHKTTTTTLSSHYFDQWEPHNQMTLYTIAGGVVLGTPIKGVIISAAQIMLESPHRYIRGFTYRTPDQLTEWLESLAVYLSAAEAYAKAEYWPMNDTACDKFGGCKFREICSKSPVVRDKFLAADFDRLTPEERWNPLRSR
jgi:hypothetical protein